MLIDAIGQIYAESDTETGSIVLVLYPIDLSYGHSSRASVLLDMSSEIRVALKQARLDSFIASKEILKRDLPEIGT